jgi:hypothetical protein
MAVDLRQAFMVRLTIVLRAQWRLLPTYPMQRFMQPSQKV